MDGGDLWRVASCGSEGGDVSRGDIRILNTIMLRFRPIAPKPIAGGTVPSGGHVHGNQSKGSASEKRAKRKYVRVRRNSRYLRKNNDNDKSPEKLVDGRESRDGVAVVTLQLMPEKGEECVESSLARDSWCKNVDLNLSVEKIQIIDNLKPPRVTLNASSSNGLDPWTAVAATKVESWVTVESVTGTFMGEEGQEVVGAGVDCTTDAEKVKNLDTDTCPGFISDGNWKVRWVNDAYKKMVGTVSECEKEERELVVWLKAKDNSVLRYCYSYRAFTCSVRLQYTWQNEKWTKMVPCDVWRLESGGFAWRLDVKAALSLGL
ncbi:hypothetical protein RIF29_19558 [Crotalaria pallida]|uniref:DUF7950 domain-containing protein n=1 Tax=Crotalaria pallida TaxID=3830 RepID=A0AAN9EZN6_CROPI